MTLPGAERWLVVCETVAVPRRTVLLIRTLAEVADVEVFCWSRRGVDQIPTEVADRVVLSRGRGFASFAMEVARRLGDGSYRGVLVADSRLLGLVTVVTAGTATRVVYDRMEIPTVTMAKKMRQRVRLSTNRLEALGEACERVLVRRTSAVLTVPLVGRAMEHVRSLHSDVLVVHNWPALKELSAEGAKDVVRDRQGDEGRPFTAIHAGAISGSTGLSTILEAARILRRGRGRPVQIVLVGYLVGVRAEQLAAQVEDWKLVDRVQIMPRVPFDEMSTLVRRADVGLALLDPEDPKFRWVGRGMSRRPFTYMACGLPVISNPPQGSWIEEQGVGLCVPFDDPAGLAGALARLRDDPDLSSSLGEAGRRRVAQHDHWEQQASALRQFVVGDS